MKTLPAIVAAICLTACVTMPEFDKPGTDTALPSTYPKIMPIDGLIIQALGPSASGSSPARPLDAVTSPLAERIARLKRRAAILRGSPVDATTRGRLATAG